MLHATATAAGLAASLMLTANALALGIGQETPAQIRAFTALVPKIDLADAVSSAQSGMRGKVIYIHFVEPKGQFAYPIYEALLVSDGKLVSVNVDPITGIASMPKKVAAGSAAALGQELRIAEALKRSQWFLQQAIDTAQQKLIGQPIDAWLTERRGKPAYGIGIVEAGQIRMVVIDPMTSKLHWVPRPLTANAVSVQSPATRGNHEVATLDVLDAKARRDFPVARRKDVNFDIGAMLGGKTVTLAVGSDRGRIATRT